MSKHKFKYFFWIYMSKQKFKSICWIFPVKTQMQMNLFDFTCQNTNSRSIFWILYHKLNLIGKKHERQCDWQERCLRSFGNQDLLCSTQLRSEDSWGNGDSGVEWDIVGDLPSGGSLVKWGANIPPFVNINQQPGQRPAPG